MNGYRVEAELDGKTITAFLDMGKDLNLKENDILQLFHTGIYNNKFVKFKSPSGTERSGNQNEILVKKLINE